jgi:hypothetical protein
MPGEAPNTPHNSARTCAKIMPAKSINMMNKPDPLQTPFHAGFGAGLYALFSQVGKPR